MPKESMANRLFAFFESHDMICGLSDSFKDPSETRVHYRQALLTARLAQQLGQARSTTFSDLMPLPIFLSVLEKDSPETFIHPAIFKMRAYDRENGTSYDETMRVFSFNMHNKDKTAAELCIHRNTLLYRLGRISDLFQLPFEHDQVALNLLCSYLILELGRYGSPQTMSRLSSTEQTETEIKRD
jgi:DNA-binding PucR family transcriptional regulator